MIQINKTLYNDVGKTGTSFVLAQLHSLCNNVHVERHKLISPELLDTSTLLLSSIRNPYHYYVSNFSYEKKTSGPLISTFRRQGKQYDTFKEHVRTIYNPKYQWLQKELDMWYNKPVEVGLLTFRYLAWADTGFFKVKRTYEDVQRWYDQHYFDEYSKFKFIGQNNLATDLCDLIEKHQNCFNLKSDWKEIITSVKNSTIHDDPSMSPKGYKYQGLNYASFYDEETKNLVYSGEKILIDHFRYTV